MKQNITNYLALKVKDYKMCIQAFLVSGSTIQQSPTTNPSREDLKSAKNSVEDWEAASFALKFMW